MEVLKDNDIVGGSNNGDFEQWILEIKREAEGA
ncbi:hypothetical protein N781_08890 [Pontibacillus halophilus JSM 076056 = DSM 19796]|uniref:Uncharacterized protein n=1 Tax=Pontibacillus halophilus JSM 076056 = DSM 19796 TaxID=1385510 RepID=A0A0A5GF26_9BACI|nr:hypothetical protein N781_08890 [Pontibacillus halophilus JSM 076056 = DSM 19796]